MRNQLAQDIVANLTQLRQLVKTLQHQNETANKKTKSDIAQNPDAERLVIDTSGLGKALDALNEAQKAMEDYDKQFGDPPAPSAE